MRGRVQSFVSCRDSPPGPPGSSRFRFRVILTKIRVILSGYDGNPSDSPQNPSDSQNRITREMPLIFALFSILTFIYIF